MFVSVGNEWFDEGVEPGEGGVKEGAADVDPPSTPHMYTYTHAHTHTHSHTLLEVYRHFKKKPCQVL